MNRLLLALGILHAALAAALPAGAPEERYVEVIGIIAEADKLADAGQTRDAIPRYVEAQAALRQLQAAFPDWSPKIVAFRLSVVSARLEPLTRKPVAPAPPKLSPGEELTNQVRRLEDELSRLSNQNALLEAKLREALTVQPAASDPRELHKAEERIAQLQKERDLLNVSLEQLRQQVATVPPPAAERDRKALEEARQELSAQTAAAAELRRQNEDLQKQLAAAVRTRPTGLKGDGDAELRQLRDSAIMLQASNRVLQAELTDMERRMLDWVRTQRSAAQARETAPAPTPDAEARLAEARREVEAARAERDALAARLKEPAPAADRDARRQELAALQARVQALEAKAVPYTAEELALFQAPTPRSRPDTNPPPVATVTLTNTGSASAPAAPAASAAEKKRDTLPPGAGPLVAAAERAIDAGRYDEAEKQFATLLKQDGENAYLLARLAGAQLDQDKVGPAEEQLKKLLAVDPANPAGLQMMGDVKYRQSNFQEAVDLLSQAAQLRPELPDTHFRLGQALIAGGQRQAAEAAFRKSLQLRPGWGDPHYQLAVLYGTQKPGYPELAQYHYKRALAAGMPRNPGLERLLEQRPAP
jgi:Flp pilus assembly protein TadD